MSSVCPCNIGGLWSHRLVFFRNNFTVRQPGMFALCRLKHQRSTPRGTPEILAQSDPPAVDLSVRDIRSQIAAEWLQIAQRSQWRAYRKLPSLFLMVPSLTPYDLLFLPKWGFHMPPWYTNDHIRNGLSDTLQFGSRVGFLGSADLMALLPVTSNPSNFEWPYLRNDSFDPLI